MGGGGGGNIVILWGVWGHVPPEMFICVIDNTDLVLWLTYCMKKSFLHLGCKHVQKVGGRGGAVVLLHQCD